jgi:hypothetical protein
MGKGPVVIDKVADGFTVANGPAVPLDSLQSSTQVVVFARDEGTEGNLNGDGDPFDRVVEIVEVGTGQTTATGRPCCSRWPDCF